MTIRSGDIKFLASKVMTDDPEGGGGPVGTVIPDGASNAMFQDITEFDRAGGAVSIRQAFLAVQTPDREVFMDANLIVSMPPNDANVSVTLAKCSLFARRTDIANTIENYLIQGPEWSGFLLENHVVGQRSIQLFQRPGTPTPPIGRTLVLIFDEGLPTERKQYVRVTRVAVEPRMFTYSVSGSYQDYAADVVTCDISDALRFAFPGSPPDRLYARDPVKTVLRDTTVADAATYYGAAPLASAAVLGDSGVLVGTVYSQLVPSARTETTALDQRPAAARSITLADTPRQVTVPVAAHTQRIKIGQENRGFSFVALLKPLPEPRTIVISYMALGNWYTLSDDGAGAFEGSGAGQVLYATGSLSFTLPSLPDADSAIIIQWGEKSAFANRSGQAGFRAPEYALKLDHAGIVPTSITIDWLSGGVLKTATAGATGALSGDASGEVNYASGDLFIRPAAMPDAGAEFNITYDWATLTTKSVAATADAGGYATIALDTVPAAGSVTVEWATVRNLSNTGGGSASGTASAKSESTSASITVTAPVYYPGSPGVPSAPGTTPPVPGTNAPPPAPPVSLTRVPFNGDSGAVPYMAEGGVRTSTGKRVFIAVQATFVPEGGYYAVPDSTGVAWSETEFNTTRAKTISGVTYRRWGADDQARAAEGA